MDREAKLVDYMLKSAPFQLEKAIWLPSGDQVGE